ncbi:hypothetical protein [Cupriavidus yeoncheonensis]|uniref:hypothetical protein n=1 Tax=Cupriavidus yeoncheonensis TaxID=1462994 RepID=UPI001BA82D69|nr:hypothetical protein [Cupriavidus yeoncheonensis]
MQKPFQNWLHAGADCTAVVGFAPDCHQAGAISGGGVVQPDISNRAERPARATMMQPEWVVMNRDGALHHSGESRVRPGHAVVTGRQAGAVHLRSRQKSRRQNGRNRGQNLPLSGLKQGFPGFFVALVPLGIAQGAKGRLDCADRCNACWQIHR